MMPDETPIAPMPLPTEGGSYERLADGSLRRIPDEPEAAPEPSAEPAPKTSKRKE